MREVDDKMRIELNLDYPEEHERIARARYKCTKNESLVQHRSANIFKYGDYLFIEIDLSCKSCIYGKCRRKKYHEIFNAIEEKVGKSK